MPPYSIGSPIEIITAPVTDTSTTSTIATTSTVTVPNNALIMAIVANRGSSTTNLSTFSDGTANVYTVVKSVPTTSRGIGIATCYATNGLASGATLTATLGASASRKAMDIFYWTGMQSAVVDVSATAEGSTGTPDSSASGTTGQNIELVIGAFSHNPNATSDTASPGSGYTQLSYVVIGTTTIGSLYAEYKITSSTGTQDATFTPSNTTTGWSALVATYKAFIPAAPPVVAGQAPMRGATW